MITDEQFDFIAKKINSSAIKNQELRDDLIDHFCCVVEMGINKGLSFEQAYQRAYQQTTPNGFQEIQHETIFLLNYNKIMNLKRLTYLSGFVFSLAFVIGIQFKLLHWPGANILLFSGMTGAACIFAPLLLINHYKQNLKAVLSVRLMWIFGTLSIVLLTLSSWMKIGHLMGANIVLILFFVCFGFGYLPFLFFRMYKKSIETV